MTDIPWIDVQNQLPHDGEEVLVVSTIYDPDSFLCQRHKNWIFIGKFFRTEGWYVTGKERNNTYVSHWAPLPNIPKYKDPIAEPPSIL